MNSHTPISALAKSFAFALALCAIGHAQAQEGKFGFIDSTRVLRDSAPARAASAKIEGEFKKREKELQDIATRFKAASDKYDRDLATLPESERIRRQRELAEMDTQFQRKQREFNEDLAQRRNDELNQLTERINKVIKTIAEAEKFDLVLQEAVYVNPKYDITDKVLKALSSK